ncbi:MAG: GGDEF domain-containing protein [Candidatus Omnitrophica bacterium]|nr:GGDEF domain-containing protein [Candidatus Omnitrophota bacterium]
MLLILSCWILAMASGLCWARPYTALATASTLLAFVVMQGEALAYGIGWLQLAALGATPWLLAAQRQRYEEAVRRLHAEEAADVMRLSESARALLSLQDAMQQMESQIAQITDLYHVTKETARALHVGELFAASLESAPRLLNARGLRLIDCSGASPQVLRASRAADGRMVPPPVETGGGMAPVNGRDLLEMEDAILQRVRAAPGPASATAEELPGVPPELGRVAWAPLWREQQAVGVLVADALPEDQLKMLTIVSNQLSLQLARVHLYQQVEALAVTDALTGVSVRGHFLERARQELDRSSRHGLCCTLLMADLDDFKRKNDTFGHLVGDVVLREVARLLARNLREIDMIARFGGEEFLLLLIETGAEQALPIAERLRQLVEVHPIRAYDELLAQTVSIGMAGFPAHATTLEALIERADQALYAAKRGGRNRVVVCE